MLLENTRWGRYWCHCCLSCMKWSSFVSNTGWISQ